MCSTLAEKGETILFRSYSPPPDSTPVSSGVRDMDFSDVTIQEAARATSAAPTYLPEMIIKNFKFWDGGLLNNNPVVQVWDARYDLAAETQTPAVSCVLSIGTSWSTHKPVSSNFFKRFLNTISQTIAFATNTEAKHRDFERNIRRANQRLPEDQRTSYFRFNASTDNESVNLDDWQRMGRLKEYTRKYIQDPDTQRKIDECANVLARR
jgi:predicted acylesterase/phospholipase RssA